MKTLTLLSLILSLIPIPSNSPISGRTPDMGTPGNPYLFLLLPVGIGINMPATAEENSQTLWIEMKNTTDPQLAYFPAGITNLRFQGTLIQSEDGWDILEGGWQTLSNITKGRGVNFDSELVQLVGWGQLSLVVQSHTPLKPSCLIGWGKSLPETVICFKASPTQKKQ